MRPTTLSRDNLPLQAGASLAFTGRYSTARSRKLRVGYVLLSHSSNPAPSTRIAALNMFPFLREANFEPLVVFEPPAPCETPDLSSLSLRLVDAKLDIVVFQKVCGPSVEKLARQLSGAGVKTVFCVCDFIEPGMVEATDLTIAVTDYLKSLYPPDLHSKIRVVHDGIENVDAYKTAWRSDRGSRRNPLRAVLVTAQHLDELPSIGSPPEWLQVTIVGRYGPTRMDRAREVYWRLMKQASTRERLRYMKFLASPRIRRVPWHPVAVYSTMCEADIGIIPVQTTSGESGTVPPSWKLRSENRLTMKMSIGLPVVATPIPAYEPVIEHGQNGYFAHSRQDWMKHLEELRDPELRIHMGTQARQSVLHKFSKEHQASLLIEALDSLAAYETDAAVQRK